MLTRLRILTVETMCKDCPPEVVRWVTDLCCGPATSDYIDNFATAELRKWHPGAESAVTDGDKIK